MYVVRVGLSLVGWQLVGKFTKCIRHLNTSLVMEDMSTVQTDVVLTHTSARQSAKVTYKLYSQGSPTLYYTAIFASLISQVHYHFW